MDELPPPEVVPPVTIIEKQLPNSYKIFEIDLSIVRADEPLGLKKILTLSGAEFATYLSIIDVPAAFSFKVNNTGFDAISAAQGLEWADFEITEIFITNASLAGTAHICIEWRVD